MHRRSALLLFALAGAGVAGCGNQPTDPTPTPTPSPTPTPEPTPTPTPEPTPTPTPEPEPGPRWPLTGRPLADPAAARHAAVAVKVPDNRNEHPQASILDADIVFVQLEGYGDSRGESATRLVPVYHTGFPGRVAPVRSLRPVDVPLLAPMRAVVGSTGASEWVTNYARQFAHLVDTAHTNLRSRGAGAYSIDRSRVRTVRGTTYYDRAVVCHPGVLAGMVGEPFSAGPPQPYLPFAATDAEASTRAGRPATSISVPWKDGHRYDMRYEWDAAAGVYARSMPWGRHVQSDGRRVTTDNVLVVRASQRVGRLARGAGTADPIHEIVDNAGTFLYAQGGALVEGTWTKGPVESAFAFTLADGRPLAMAPGRTFVELPALDADVRVA